MSCIFCDALNHVSENCGIYVSKESRQSNAISKNLCQYCLVKDCVSITKKFIVTKCKSIRKCYICFTKNSHHTAFCPVRSTAAKLFVPNIDPDLLPRFLATLESYEKCTLAFQSPTIFALGKLSPILIYDQLERDPFNNYSDPNINICKSLNLGDFVSSENDAELFEKIASKHWEIYAERITVEDTYVSAFELYAVLSTKTKFLKLNCVEFTSEISLDKIFEKAPNLEEFEFQFDTWQDNVWQDDTFFKHYYGRSFKKLKITVDHKIDVTKLIPFLKKSTPHITFEVYVDVPFNENQIRERFKAEILKYMYLTPVKLSAYPSMAVYLGKLVKKTRDTYGFVGFYVLKNMVADPEKNYS